MTSTLAGISVGIESTHGSDLKKMKVDVEKLDLIHFSIFGDFLQLFVRRTVTILEETLEVTLQPNSTEEEDQFSSSNSFQELTGNFFLHMVRALAK